MTENTLSARLARAPILIAPGVYDALTALIAERAGFEALYVSGAGIAYTRLGRPDIGLVSMSEVVQTVDADPRPRRRRISSSMPIPVTAMRSTCERTVRLLERAGANAIQIEDQDFPKRCGHLDDKTLISAQEMAGKIKAAVDARASPRHADHRAHRRGRRSRASTAPSARAALYREAGADMLFVEAPRQRDELGRIGHAARQVRSADGQHGGRRQDADAAGERA